MDTNDTLADELTPEAPTEHPFVTAIKNILGGLVPSADAADTSKMIGGPAYSIDSNGQITTRGVKVGKDTLQFDINRQKQAIANNAKNPEVWNSPAMQKIREDMEQQLANMNEVLAKAK
jgi:hypothetical protein